MSAFADVTLKLWNALSGAPIPLLAKLATWLTLKNPLNAQTRAAVVTIHMNW